MAGIITVSPYIGIRPTELITTSVIQAEPEMAGEADGAVVGLCRLLELIEALTPFVLVLNISYMFAYLIVFVASKFIRLSGTMVNGLYYTGMNTNDKMSQVEIIKAIFQHYFEAYIAWRLIRYVTLFLMGNNYEN
jgi:uncharacterized protein YggT (Ycf19 family)